MIFSQTPESVVSLVVIIDVVVAVVIAIVVIIAILSIARYCIYRSTPVSPSLFAGPAWTSGLQK